MNEETLLQSVIYFLLFMFAMLALDVGAVPAIDIVMEFLGL